MARIEKQWRAQVVKDEVGCMMGFYVMRVMLDGSGGGAAAGADGADVDPAAAAAAANTGKEIINVREDMGLVVAQATFSPTHELLLENVELNFGEVYMVLCCTYDPKNLGDFMCTARRSKSGYGAGSGSVSQNIADPDSTYFDFSLTEDRPLPRAADWLPAAADEAPAPVEAAVPVSGASGEEAPTSGGEAAGGEAAAPAEAA